MLICARVDELRVDPHFIRGALHAAFKHMGDAKLLADFAHVALGSASVLHYAGAADHFQIGHFRQISQDLALHSIGEIGAPFFLAEIIEGENGDALLRDRNWRIARPGWRNGRRNRSPWRSMKIDERTTYQNKDQASYGNRKEELWELRLRKCPKDCN